MGFPNNNPLSWAENSFPICFLTTAILQKSSRFAGEMEIEIRQRHKITISGLLDLDSKWAGVRAPDIWALE